MTRPILAVDIDGVISLFGAETPPDRAFTKLELVDGVPHLISLPVGDRLARLGEHFAAHWKLGPLEEFATGRALAWIDDNLDDSCYEWAEQREHPTLLVPTETHLGLEEAHVEALRQWAVSLH